MAEQEKSKELEIQQATKNKEEQEKQMEKQMASMKLAYNNLDKQREKEEAKLMQTDPKKAKQLERLGMAAGTRQSGVSHSAVSDMQIIQQEGDSRVGSSQSSTQPSSVYGKGKDFFDDMDNEFGFKSKKNEDDLFKSFSSSKSSEWVVVDDKFNDETDTNTKGPSILSIDNDFSK